MPGNIVPSAAIPEGPSLSALLPPWYIFTSLIPPYSVVRLYDATKAVGIHKVIDLQPHITLHTFNR
jgi:hypothetical protein